MRRYKEQKKVAKAIRNAKRKMEKRIATDKDDQNGRKFSRYIRSKTKNMTGISPLKNSKGTLITENSEMAEELNKFFTSVFTKDSSYHIPYLSEILEQSTDLLALSE